MSAWAKPGVKCVCIDGVRPESWGFQKLGTGPKTDGVYTISEVRDVKGIHVLVLKEFPDVPGTGWETSHFRPLITRTQEDDVRLIKSLLLEDAGLVPAGVELDA
jgi:hypothetical protein